MTRKVAERSDGEEVGWQWGAGSGSKRFRGDGGEGCRDQFLEHWGLAPYRPAEIWVCAGSDGWSDGLQDLMA